MQLVHFKSIVNCCQGPKIIFKVIFRVFVSIVFCCRPIIGRVLLYSVLGNMLMPLPPSHKVGTIKTAHIIFI